MIKYGKASRVKIDELDGRLQRLLHRYSDSAPADLDLSVICGHRGEAEQNAAYAAGKSKKRWPESGHNKQPAKAFDFLPYPFHGWGDTLAFARIQGALRIIAEQEGIALKPMITWDLPHVELAG